MPHNWVHRHIQSFPNEKITADDARLFTKSVPLSGPNAVTWPTALGLVAPLLKCDSSWTRFDGTPDKAEKVPCSGRGKEDHAAFLGVDVTGDTPAYYHPASAASPSLPGTPAVNPIHGFPTLPSEVRDEIWLGLEKPAILRAYILCLGDGGPSPSGVKLIVPIPGSFPNFPHTDAALFRDWASIPLYDLSRESEDVAIREYGRPTLDSHGDPDCTSVPFRSATDELRVVVDGETRSEGAYYYFGGIDYPELQYYLPHWDSEECRRCDENRALLEDPSLPVLFSTGRDWNSHRREELIAPSADFLKRIHRVTIDLAYRDPKYEGKARLAGQQNAASMAALRHRQLAAALRRGLPNLSTLTVLVDPMQGTRPGNMDYLSYNPSTNDVYHPERVFLLDALTQLVKHAPECDKHLSSCRCSSLPFPNLKKFVVRVNTRRKVSATCNHDSLNPFGRSHFTVDPLKDLDPSTDLRLLVCKKGSLPLSDNCWKYECRANVAVTQGSWDME